MGFLSSIFGDNRPKFKKNLDLSEIALNVLKYQMDERIQALKDVVFIALPIGSTVHDLKHRIHGLSHIPTNRIRLMLCGHVLSDQTIVPEEVFESQKKASTEEDIYRARLFLSMQPINEDGEEDADSVSSELSNDDDIPDAELEGDGTEEETEAQKQDRILLEKMAAEQKAVEAAERKVEEERNARAAELEAKAHAEHKKSKVKIFDLQKDLDRIMAGHFYEALYAAGFRDEGAFSEITDEVLLEKDLYFPRKARVRIVALADSIKRRIEVRSKGNKIAAKDLVGQQMRESDQIKGSGIEGLEGVYTTKAELNRAYAAKMKQDAEEKREMNFKLQKAEDFEIFRKEPTAKQHKEDIANKIKIIRHQEERDEFDIPKNVYRIEQPEFCCSKHKREVLDRRSAFVNSKSEGNRNDISMSIKGADKDGLGFISRDILRILANLHFTNRGFKIDPKELEDILDRSIVNGEEQKVMFEWTGKEKFRRQNPFSFIPVAIYDSNFVINELCDRLQLLEYDRFVQTEEDRIGKYIVNKFKGGKKGSKETKNSK